MASLTIPLTQPSPEAHPEHDSKFLGCLNLEPARSFLWCCPLQFGVYVISILCLAQGVLWSLSAFTEATLPWLFRYHTSNHDNPVFLILHGSLNLLHIGVALGAGHYTWKSASSLNLKASRTAEGFIWGWLALSLMSTVPLAIICFVTSALLLDDKLPGAVVEALKGHDAKDIPRMELSVLRAVIFMFGVLMVLVSILTSFLAASVNFLLWSFRKRLVLGERALVLTGRTDLIVMDVPSANSSVPGEHDTTPWLVMNSPTDPALTSETV